MDYRKKNKQKNLQRVDLYTNVIGYSKVLLPSIL